MPTVPDILVVCSGNICRSPYAQGYLWLLLGQRGLTGEVRSGGTLGIQGAPASPETLQLARESGFDLGAHRSRGIHFEDVDEAGVILVMENAHRRALVDSFPDSAGKIHLLSEYHPSVREPSRAPDIFDPIGHPLDGYRRCFALVRDSLAGFLDGAGPRTGR